MNEYEAILYLILALSLILPVAYFKYEIKKLDNTMTNLDAYINVNLGPQIKTIRQLVTDEIINKKEDCIMNKEDFIQEVKMEWLNEDVELGTDKETVESRAYARGWNACQREILNNIDKAFPDKEVES